MATASTTCSSMPTGTAPITGPGPCPVRQGERVRRRRSRLPFRASDGFAVSAVGFGDLLGLGIASAGDINGDGFDDFVVSAPSRQSPAEGNGGKTYVVFGKAGGLSSFSVGSLTLPDGFFIQGDLASDQAGLERRLGRRLQRRWL